MNRNGTKPKKGKPQKLIIPKGTLDNNDTAVIEIPSEYRNQEVVIAKKSNISNYSKMDQSIGTGSFHRTNFKMGTSFDRRNETGCQTLFDERDIEKLMEDLETYYYAQKNFLIKSSTLIRKQIDECQNQQQSNLCGCSSQKTSSTTSTGCPTVILLKNGCMQDASNSNNCDSFRPSRTPEPQPCYNHTWGGNESHRINMSGSYYEPNQSMPRNMTQFSATARNQHSFMNGSPSAPTNESFRSHNGNSTLQTSMAPDSNYELFRDGANRSMDTSKSQYGTPLETATSSQIKFDSSSQPPSKSILKTTNMDESLDSSAGNYSFNRQMESFR